MPIGKKNKKPKQIFLGLDPGLADTGYGVISLDDGILKLLDCGSIKTQKNIPLPARLKIIETNINKLIKKYRPQLAGVEELFFCKNTSTAMAVGQARGVVILALAKNRLPILEFTPLQIKQGVTGYGRADKKQIQEMVRIILGLKNAPHSDDAADALAVAICTSSSYYLKKL